MSEAFQRIEKSIKDAIAFAQGKNIEVRINRPPQIDLPSVAYVGSPRLAHPEQVADFKKEVVEEECDAEL